MSRIIEELLEKERAEARREIFRQVVKSLLTDEGFEPERIAQMLRLPLDEVERLSKEQDNIT